MNFSRKKTLGFSLIELLLVVGFITMTGILISIVVSKVSAKNDQLQKEASPQAISLTRYLKAELAHTMSTFNIKPQMFEISFYQTPR